MLGLKRLTNILKARAAADPDLQISGRGGGGGLKIFFLSALWASSGVKNKGEAGSPGPSLGSTTEEHI